MKPKLFVPPLTDGQRRRLTRAARGRQAFAARRAQILLQSADGTPPPRIAKNLGCSPPTVRAAIRAFARDGLGCLAERSSRPHSSRPLLGRQFTEPLKDLLRHSPRLFGQPTGLWTLALVAEVCHARGWTPRRLSPEGVRLTLKRLGIRWRRAKHWISSPDPAYARKKKPATG